MSGGFVSGIKKFGHALDSGISSFVSEIGQKINTTCPVCSKLMQAAPNTVVVCPFCHHQFTSPTFTTRVVEVSKDLSEDAKKSWESASAGKAEQPVEHPTKTDKPEHPKNIPSTERGA